jgi:aspartate racemase
MEGMKQSLLKIIDKMLEGGAEGVIVGCTELPILLKDTDRPIFDSSKILVEALFKAL